MRNRYNISHLAHVAGHIGRIQTISVIPVVAGDSIEIHMDGIFRLAPTRKEIVSECQFDICAFWVPHRHIYTINWKEIVSEGVQSSETLEIGPVAPAGARNCFYLGIKDAGPTVNKALVAGYNGIITRYFAVPTSAGNGEIAFSPLQDPYITTYPTLTTAAHNRWRMFGTLAPRLPHILNGGTIVNQSTAGGFTRAYDSEDWGVQIPQDTPSAGIALLDIRDLNQIQSRYSSIQEQNYFAQFYNDVMDQKWGSSVSTDADPRPTYLGRETHFISGHDINGTDDATLGSYVGKTLDRVNFHLPRRFMPEHGNLWILAVARFPLVHTKEQHPLLANVAPDTKLLLADPKIWSGEPVVAFDPGAWLSGGSVYTPNLNAVQQPYGQEYRYQPNRVHPVFEQIPGYPFTSWDSSTPDPWYYYQDNEYANTFQTSQVGQWQLHAALAATRYSSITDPKTSIFAGA